MSTRTRVSSPFKSARSCGRVRSAASARRKSSSAWRTTVPVRESKKATMKARVGAAIVSRRRSGRRHRHHRRVRLGRPLAVGDVQQLFQRRTPFAGRLFHHTI
jgi:hypothetical protein